MMTKHPLFLVKRTPNRQNGRRESDSSYSRWWESNRRVTRKVRKLCSHYSWKTELHEIDLAQTFDRLSFPWAARGSNVFPGPSLRQRRQRRMDQPRFSRTYHLDLHRVARHRYRLELDCRPVVSAVRDLGNSLWCNAGFLGPAYRGCFRVRSTAPPGRFQ